MKSNLDCLDVHILSGADGEFALSEADRASLEHGRDVCTRTRFRCDETLRLITVDGISTTYTGATRKIKLVLHTGDEAIELTASPQTLVLVKVSQTRPTPQVPHEK